MNNMLTEKLKNVDYFQIPRLLWCRIHWLLPKPKRYPRGGRPAADNRAAAIRPTAMDSPATLLLVTDSRATAVHGGYDLANAFNPPAANIPALADLPNQVDPRGLLTFGVAGMSAVVFALVIVRGGALPKTFGYLGYLLGILLIVVYLGRLIILDANNMAIVVPALLAGFVVSPLWYLWLGLRLRR